MISLRQHLISLIAVFLALGLGVVAGSTFISPVTVSALKKSIDALDRRDQALEAQNNQLSQSNGVLAQFSAAARDLLVHNTLAGRPAVLVSFDATPAGDITAMASALAEAGTHLQGSVVLSSTLALPDDASRQQVAAAVGVATAPGDALAAALIHQLAGALSGASPGVFARLQAQGLAKLNTVPSSVPAGQLATLGSAVIILAPAVPQPGARVSADVGRSVILPLVRALSGASLVAVAEDGAASLPVLTPIRQDVTLKVVTVDGVDAPMGQAAVVLGLLAAAGGTWGDYGSGPGATGLLPGTLPVQPVSPTPAGSPAG